MFTLDTAVVHTLCIGHSLLEVTMVVILVATFVILRVDWSFVELVLVDGISPTPSAEVRATIHIALLPVLV
jgi:hypothetical protein